MNRLRGIVNSQVWEVCRIGLLAALLLLVAGCAARPVTEPGPGLLPARLDGGTARMDDGIRLPLHHWVPAGRPLAVVLALHGFNDYGNAFAGVGAYLAGQGILTVAVDQRGFGAAPDPGRWAGGGRMVADAARLLGLLRTRYPGLPLFLLGESMGAAVALELLGGPEPPPVAGAILVAPAVWDRGAATPLLRLTLELSARICPGCTATGEGLGIHASDNLEMLRALGRDPLVAKATRLDTLRGLVALMDGALGAADRVRAPLLVQYGAHDQVIPRPALCRLLARLPAQSRRVAFYTRGYHMLTRDLEGGRVRRDLAAWIRDSDAPLPSGEERPSAAWCPAPPAD